MHPDLSIAILAGGKSSRFQGNKLTHTYQQTPIILRVLEAARSVSSSVCFVSRQGAEVNALLSPHAEVIFDQAPYEGPLAALCAALVWSPRPRVLVIAGDLVLLRAEVIERLVSLPSSAKAFAPVLDGVIQPLCAVYSSSLSGEALRLLGEGARAAKALFLSAQGEAVSPSQLGDIAEVNRMLRGVNTREELASLEETRE